MLKNFWIERVFRLFFAVLVGRNGVVLRLQPDSQIQKSGCFFQKLGCFFQHACFENWPQSLTFFTFYRERRMKRGGKALKNAIQKLGRFFQKSKMVHPEVTLRFSANFWMVFASIPTKTTTYDQSSNPEVFFPTLPAGDSQ